MQVRVCEHDAFISKGIKAYKVGNISLDMLLPYNV